MADGGVAVREYWASTFDIRELAPRVMERMKFHLSLLRKSGRLDKMRAMLSAYYGLGTDGTRDTSSLGSAGAEGEVTELTTNQVRPIITNALSLIAGQKIETKTRSQNEDASTLAQTRLAQALLEATELSSSTQEREVDCVRGGLIASSWSMGQSWRPKDGKEWSRDENGQPLFDGDIAEFILAPWHVAFDASATNDAERKWCLFCKPESRFDLAAQFDVDMDAIENSFAEEDPERDQKIQAAMAGAARKNATALKIRQPSSGMMNSPVPAPYDSVGGGASVGVHALDALLGEVRNPEDTVWVWELRHLKTPALPDGRLIRFIEPDIVLWDSMEQQVPYPYDELHMFEFCPERVVAGGQGYTGAFDLGALQEMVDICTASMASTININGQNTFWQKDDKAPNLQVLANNATVLISPEEPKVLQFPALKQEVLQAAEWFISMAAPVDGAQRRRDGRTAEGHAGASAGAPACTGAAVPRRRTGRARAAPEAKRQRQAEALQAIRSLEARHEARRQGPRLRSEGVAEHRHQRRRFRRHRDGRSGVRQLRRPSVHLRLPREDERVSGSPRRGHHLPADRLTRDHHIDADRTARARGGQRRVAPAGHRGCRRSTWPGRSPAR